MVKNKTSGKDERAPLTAFASAKKKQGKDIKINAITAGSIFPPLPPQPR